MTGDDDAMTDKAPDLSKMKGPEALFKTDASLEEEGIWLDYGDFRIRIRRAGPNNKRFKTTFDKAMKPHRAAMANDRMNEKVAMRVTQEVWAETIVMGWDSQLGDGVMPYQGKPYQFSVDNVKQLFADLPDLFIDIRDQSTKMSLFLEDVETDAGN